MRSVPARALIFGFVLAAGCKPEPPRPDGAPPWWQPAPGEAADWDIQLSPAATGFDVSMPRAMYTIDLWDAVPAQTMLDYGDGSPVTVPAGTHSGAIAQLRALAASPMVVCHVGTGAIRLDDPDATKFPGYQSNPPNNPTPPADGSVIGWSPTDTDPMERFIDLHEASRAIVAPLIGKRLELAKAIGCDAIASRYSDQRAYQANPGLGFADLSTSEYASWSREIAGRAHALTLSIGLRAATAEGISNTAPIYDWLMLDRCAEHDTCDPAKEYLNRRKAVFAIEYDLTEEEMKPNSVTASCSDLTRAGITDGIIKSAALDSTYHMRCM